MLPTMIANAETDDEDLDDFEAVMAALPLQTLSLLYARGLSVEDVLAGKVAGLDPDALIAQARADNA